MRGRSFAVVCMCATAVVFATNHAPAADADTYNAKHIETDVLYSDLVVRGVVTALGSIMVPSDSLFPRSKPSGGTFPVTTIDVKIDEVIKGAWRDASVRAHLHGDPKAGAFVGSIKYDYEVGQEVILCLRYDPRVLGGAYRLAGDWGSYVMRDGAWMSREGNKVVLADSVRSMARRAEPMRMFDAADAVVVASIDSIVGRLIDKNRPPMIGGIGARNRPEVEHVTVTVKESWKGSSAGERILVRVLKKWGSWYAPVPKLSVGETYLMFIRRDDVGYYPFIGFNGFLRVEGDGLIMNGHLEYPFSKTEMSELLSK